MKSRDDEFYLKDRYPQYDIGKYTYGLAEVKFGGKIDRLVIGKYCSIAGGVNFYFFKNHEVGRVSTYPFSGEKDWSDFKGPMPSVELPMVEKPQITVGNDVWIGFGALILPGVTIGDGAVIGAFTVVASYIRPYAIVIGNPAKELETGRRFSDDEVDMLMECKWWDWPDNIVDDHHHLLRGGDPSQIYEAWLGECEAGNLK